MSKNLDAGYNWDIYFKALGYNASLILNNNNTPRTGAWGSSTFTTNTFQTSNSFSSANGEEYIYYCFAEKTGYSKFGTYTGNGSTDGKFLYTGFKPSLFIHKRYDTTGNWGMFDNKRSTSDGNNVINYWVNPDLSNAEGSSSSAMNIDFVSNGVKIREDNGDLNANNGNYAYMCFGQSLVGSNNTPCTAR